ncbi:hypothetical protein B296_00035744 [Ensete ventricosum]|uniref:Uncharacterized protein n=1 Tax=Ensete ventricosum TaxID=4639 RepID=A0A426YDV2_ENSVE|nr:hypothetical protein B296_00035744 [Ensete ventricosum]
MTVEGQRDAKNVAMIPSVRTLGYSKLRVISIGDRPPRNSIGFLPPYCCSKVTKKIHLFIKKSG